MSNNVNMPSEQSRSTTTATASPRDMSSAISKNSTNMDGSTAATTGEATTTTTVGKNKRPAEVQDATSSCCTDCNTGYSQEQHCRHHHHIRRRHQPSVKLSLREISDIIDPFFGTSTALPSSQQQEQQQQQRGQQHDDHHHHHENAPQAASNDHNDFFEVFSEVENPRQGLASSISTDGDESIGATAEGSQAIQELIEAPSDSWIHSIWEMELEKNKMS